MTTANMPSSPIDSELARAAQAPSDAPQTILQLALRSGRVRVGGGILLVVLLACIVTLPFTLNPHSEWFYARQISELVRTPPMSRVVDTGVITRESERQYATDIRPFAWAGYDMLGRSMFARCLMGGTISLAVGAAAAAISVILGVTVGLIAGYRGGLTDSALMRIVDVLYGLPYILLVVLFKIAFERPLAWLIDSSQAANLVILFMAIGLVSWLTMARVVRGQVLSIRAQPYIEACRALGLPERRIFIHHILPNLVGPIIVYATLTVPQAILQESFLSFLGIGVNAPLPTWGSLAAEGVAGLSPVRIYWWMLLFPCILLVVTLLSLNFVGDGLRDALDPQRDLAKI